MGTGLKFVRSAARRRAWLAPAWLALLWAAPMSASDSSSPLHPLGQPIAPGEIQFTLRGAATAGAPFAVECVYRPHREREVKKTRRLNLLGGLFGSGARDVISVQREESHSVRWEFTAPGADAAFTVPLRAPGSEHADYQLASVRVVSGAAGTLEFERWFPAAPELDPGFGLTCAADTLRGMLRPGGLGALPLAGSPPLWPALRTVDLTFAPVKAPVVQLWDSTAKHHWDGWRQTTPQEWPGGRSIVVRHTGGATVWRENDYHAIPPAGAPRVAQPAPPEGVLPGVRLEVFWPEGDTLEFPEARFGRPADVMASPLATMPARFGELLARSVALRPGCEPGSLTAAEWKELEALAATKALPARIELAAARGDTRLKITRRRELAAPWVCVFGSGYDDGRRIVVTALLLNPARWVGPLPE